MQFEELAIKIKETTNPILKWEDSNLSKINGDRKWKIEKLWHEHEEGRRLCPQRGR